MVAASVPRSRWGAVERAPTRPATREGGGAPRPGTSRVPRNGEPETHAYRGRDSYIFRWGGGVV